MIVVDSKIINHKVPKNFYGIYNSESGTYLTGESMIVNKNCGMLDEMDFFQANSQKKDIFKLYNQIRSRIESRFISRGLIRNSRLVLLSSKRSNSDFLESYIQKVKSDPRRAQQLYLVDRPIWEVKTSDYPLNGPTFPVAVGSKSLQSLIISNGEEEIYRDQGYRVIKVPESLRLSFESDLNLALQDKAGIALDNNLKFLQSSKITHSFTNKDKLSNPFNTEVILTTIDDERSIMDYMDINKLLSNVDKSNLYIHADLAFSNDRLGLAGSILKIKDIYTKVGDSNIKTTKVYAQPVFYIGIQSEKGHEINLNKVPEFIKQLDEIGCSIKRFSADTFQSKSILQDLRKYDTISLSVDRPSSAYEYFKSLLQTELISLYSHDLLEKELNDLVRNTVTGKIDHPTTDGTSSKDISDAVVGSCYNAITSEESSELSASYSMNYTHINSVTDSILIDKNNELIASTIRSEENLDDDIRVSSNYDNIFEIYDKL